MLQASITKLSVTFLLVHCVCDVAAGRIVRAAEDSGHVTESPGPAVTSVTEAPVCDAAVSRVTRALRGPGHGEAGRLRDALHRRVTSGA